MGPKILACLVLLSIRILVGAAAETLNADVNALMALKDMWKNTPTNWQGSDPCGDRWDGIHCIHHRVTSLNLVGIGLKGQLSGDIQLPELQYLILSYNEGLEGPLSPLIGSTSRKLLHLALDYCSFSGPIPDAIGSLVELTFLSLNSNRFSGSIPPSIGNLAKLDWLDLTNNTLTGSIPVSNGTAPGLDMLHHAKHFHFGQNQLSGTIPPKLFHSDMILIHVLFEGNKLSGSIPSTLGLVQKLELVRLDRNLLTGPVPPNLNNLTNLINLFLSNNELTGPMPSLTGMNSLYTVDMSNNSFDASEIPDWFSTLPTLATLMMESTQLQGQVPVHLFSLLNNLQTLELRNNNLSGLLDIGTDFSSQLQLIDLQNNSINRFAQGPSLNQISIILVDNPFCRNTGATEKYCMGDVGMGQSNSLYSIPENNCGPNIACSSDEISSPNCKCAYPLSGTLLFKAPSFSDFGNRSYLTTLEQYLMKYFQANHFPVDSVSLSNMTKDSFDSLELSLQIFPSGTDRFNRTGISTILSMLSNHSFDPPSSFGHPYYLINSNLYAYFALFTPSNKSPDIGVIIGATAGGSVLVLLLVLAGVYVVRQKKRAEKAIDNNPFASGDLSRSGDGIPWLKGARCFSFEELKKFTNNFSEANKIGSGGYGMVYRATLPSGQLVAIKRAQQGSLLPGSIEFKNEIELLSRVHHKNVVCLVGFCHEKGEQMLVYEYIPNGNLKESLSGKSGIRLDWMRRIKVALGVARGLAYLHEHANPPIIHRDIKTNNILLDDSLNAKVGDFGLSKPMGDSGRGHITSQVKGTMGYLDPEYYMTHQLTEKSDIYSFGVVMLELITARRPIERGKYIVREVMTAMDKTKDLYNLHEILDPTIGLCTTLKGLERFVDVAMSCVKEAGADRPTMGEVVKEIEDIMQLAGLNPSSGSGSTSTNYEGATQGYPYSHEALSNYIRSLNLQR